MLPWPVWYIAEGRGRAEDVNVEAVVVLAETREEDADLSASCEKAVEEGAELRDEPTVIGTAPKAEAEAEADTVPLLVPAPGSPAFIELEEDDVASVALVGEAWGGRAGDASTRPHRFRIDLARFGSCDAIRSESSAASAGSATRMTFCTTK